jgi:ankyrin repeat protein
VGHKEVAELLIANGADVNAVMGASGQTALHWTGWHKHKEIAELLIAAGADVNAKDDRGSTPLDYAAYGGSKEVAELFIAEGADVKAKNKNGWIPLHSAAWEGHKEVAELLIEKGADVNARDKNGHTPLHKAAFGGHKEVAELLIAEGADVNAKHWLGQTPLHRAAEEGHKEVAELLIANGAGVNAKDNLGYIPLHGAASKGRMEVVELLIANGANVNAQDDHGKTPFELTIEELAHLVEISEHLGEEDDFMKEIYERDIQALEEVVNYLNPNKFLLDRLAAIEATLGQLDKDQTQRNETFSALAITVLGQAGKLDKLQGLILGDGDAVGEPSIEKLQGVFVIRGKVGGKYEVQYHTGDNEWQLRETVTLQANRQLYIDSSSYDEKRFYRVKLVE